MAKKKQKQSAQKQNDQLSIKDQLNDSLLKQLQAKKQALSLIEEEQKETERKEAARIRKEKEKNKSFEELLNESDMNWSEFKK
ncbi:YqkE family protein [Priestia sp. Y58]|uniref:YqkE family protein n=1 Tax=Priestia TaxID=2800373 RepID=UPI001C8E71E6|nr:MULTISPECIES: YqkE family protein [Priestia]MBX9984895.1 YqkE family protein [Priestia aryabhattai]MDG0028578.1 YqkE family protein [Priestia sp. Y58]MDG0057534.1 YqkE family protein [Priestia sp. P5]UYV52278.1 YqkE family protein [Priestia megaterium]